jgi:hypothetical protein
MSQHMQAQVQPWEADKGESARAGPSTSFFLDCSVWGTLSWHELWRRGHSDL